MKPIQIATFNVNSVRSRLPILEQWLHKNPVELLALQETKVTDEFFPVDFFHDLGYQIIYRGQKAYNGVAVATRFEPIRVHFGFNDSEDPLADTRLILIQTPHFFLLNSYIPQGKSIDHLDYQFKMRFFQRIHNWLKNDFSLQDPLVWVGDMNVAPTAIDVANPEEKKNHVCFHEDVREVYYHTVNWGLIDLFRQFNSQPGEYSFWDYRERNSFRLNIGWRLDHILCTPSLAKFAVDCYIDKEPRGWEKPSDHTPVVACLQLN